MFSTLKQIFGFSEFRPNQQSIVEAILGKRDVFAVMPTGGGKSLCYQLPASMMDGVCVVISPLISLMKDQVDGARAQGINSAYLNSSLTREEAVEVYRELHSGQLKLLYVAPERFALPDFLTMLEGLEISFVAVDEAHCISEWGHDFRPDYLNLAVIKKRFPEISVAAFTATATNRVQTDIISRLELWEPHIIRASFDRPNLFYKVAPKLDVDSQLLKFIKSRGKDPGIVYRTSRKNVEKTAEYLSEKGIKAVPYHAGLPAPIRQQHQDLFNNDEVQVVVATIAFGMGIDKSNVRFVAHGDLPKNMEGYYQETGRAGRDGDPAYCILFYSYGDSSKIRWFIKQMDDGPERHAAETMLKRMVDFADSSICRRRQILGYFNEKYPHENCGGCDACVDEKNSIDVSTEAQMVISAVTRTKQSYNAQHCLNIVRGHKTAEIAVNQHDQLPTFGVGKNRHDENFWHLLFNELVHKRILHCTQGDKILMLTEDALKVLRGEMQVEMPKRRDKNSPYEKFPKNKRRALPKATAEDFNADLFEELRDLRMTLAKEKNVPPFVIFSDRTIHEFCRKFPTRSSQFLDIDGVGKKKLREYGKYFMDAIYDFLKRNPGAERDF